MLNRIPRDEEEREWGHFCASGTVGDYLDYLKAKSEDAGKMIGDDNAGNRESHGYRP
jgi:hypothetical protein